MFAFCAYMISGFDPKVIDAARLTLTLGTCLLAAALLFWLMKKLSRLTNRWRLQKAGV
jgi:hypothetical protein